MKRILISVAAIGGFALSPNFAAAQSTEIIVTGSLISSAYEAPYVTLARRADYMFQNVRVVCDTRDPDQRLEELHDTLRGLIAAAEQEPGIDLGIADEDIVSDFNESMFGAIIDPDARTDTSFTILSVKTALTADDTFDSAMGRISAFIEDADLVGRTLITRTGDWNLTLVGPELSRDEILRMIADESARTAAMFGPEYDVEITGLQYPVKWFRTGLLDLTLFIPYEMQISSAP